jgi:hypothetical protein
MVKMAGRNPQEATLFVIQQIQYNLHTCSNYTNKQQIPFNIYDEFNSQNSHQHVSADIPAILRVMFL